MLGAFILLVLFLTGLIETAIQLFGAGNVSANCTRYVNNNKISGVSATTLAWLEQSSICKFRVWLGSWVCLTNVDRFKLVRCIQLLDYWHHFLHMDDAHVFASGQRSIRRRSSSLDYLSTTSSIFLYIFIVFLIFLFDCSFGERITYSSLSTGIETRVHIQVYGYC